MAKLKVEERKLLIKEMERLYPQAECALNFENTFQLLIAVVLSAQTTDKSVNNITPELFAKCPDAKTLAAADQDELETILRTIGMYRTKAKNIKALAEMLDREYGGEVPADYEKLIALPGVGRKTANVVLSVGFNIPRIAVDTHVFRLANRIGLTAEKDVLKTELALMKAIPEENWILMHHALIWHGRRVCIARNPKCGECTLGQWCRKNGVK
ncbi:MAG: endonuclease III [Clostridiales bacterium]|nr:endonuclease III [Clostridiales bacterium]